MEVYRIQQALAICHDCRSHRPRPARTASQPDSHALLLRRFQAMRLFLPTAGFRDNVTRLEASACLRCFWIRG